MNKKASEINESLPWQELTPGCEIYEGGSSRLKQCLLCTPFCPDSSIPVSGGKRSDFDYDHCKGCGICYKVCPFGAIDWKEVH